MTQPFMTFELNYCSNADTKAYVYIKRAEIIKPYALHLKKILQRPDLNT